MSMLAARISGSEIRSFFNNDHDEISAAKDKSVHAVIDILSKLQLSPEQKNQLIDVISYLIILLRSRYSGLLNDENKKYFNTPENNKCPDFGVSQAGLHLVLCKILPNMRIDEIRTLVEHLPIICTHKRTKIYRFGFVKKHTGGALRIFTFLGCTEIDKKRSLKFMGDVIRYLESGLDEKRILEPKHMKMMNMISMDTTSKEVLGKIDYSACRFEEWNLEKFECLETYLKPNHNPNLGKFID